MIALLLAAAMPGQAVAPPPRDDEWLILQTAADPLALVGVAAARRAPGARVIATEECDGMRPGLFILVVKPGRAPRSPGSYVRRCIAQPYSATGRGIASVDPSFAAMRARPVNIDGGDIVSFIRSNLLVRPYFLDLPNDPREGLRVAVEDMADGRRRPIERDCTAPEVTRGVDHIAIACAVEQIAGQPVYRTVIYRARDLSRVRDIPRCRDPQFFQVDLLRCWTQTVSPAGKVVLTPRYVRF
ncbi:hypothetical protein ASE67_15020 [Sphingomonas sp. Leaf23]|uniref:hypothetical protein n=1 Tax=Sphingomonas sp. Leaf23 TaxID=1735689 RepID=UPI0006F4DAF6|nr:hypothetical protein [Sphingomonas sp. Leaf23]KQM84994.1 hypothetical protein ASE67_15020 [Sphingomonas sp. Leaf23]